MAITELAQKHGIKVILWECLVIDGERKRGVEAKSQGDWFVRLVGVINDHLIEKFGNGRPSSGNSIRASIDNESSSGSSSSESRWM
jgi:hypothetical protein